MDTKPCDKNTIPSAHDLDNKNSDYEEVAVDDLRAGDIVVVRGPTVISCQEIVSNDPEYIKRSGVDGSYGVTSLKSSKLEPKLKYYKINKNKKNFDQVRKEVENLPTNKPLNSIESVFSNKHLSDQMMAFLTPSGKHVTLPPRGGSKKRKTQRKRKSRKHRKTVNPRKSKSN